MVFILSQLNITNVLGPEISESDIAPCLQLPGPCRKQPPGYYHADGWMDGQVRNKVIETGWRKGHGIWCHRELFDSVGDRV